MKLFRLIGKPETPLNEGDLVWLRHEPSAGGIFAIREPAVFIKYDLDTDTTTVVAGGLVYDSEDWTIVGKIE